MKQIDCTADIDTRSHQEMLADSLIEHLGVDGAIQACRAFVWDGVLDVVLHHRHCN